MENELLNAISQMMDEKLSPIKDDIASLRKDLTSVRLTQETKVLPAIQLLAEGHVTIQNQIREINVIERLQDDVATLKSAVKYLSGELENLKKAM